MVINLMDGVRNSLSKNREIQAEPTENVKDELNRSNLWNEWHLTRDFFGKEKSVKS